MEKYWKEHGKMVLYKDKVHIRMRMVKFVGVFGKIVKY